jgi:hypothetical protein
MAENNDKNKEDEKIFHREFISQNTDFGIAYVENYFKRKFETMNSKNIYDALMHAADKGGEDKNMPHLMFIRELIKGNSQLFTMLTKEQRHEIFTQASLVDRKIALSKTKDPKNKK